MATHKVQSRVHHLDSTLDAVDQAENLVLTAAQSAGLSEDDASALGMALRECLVNAVVHGNRYNAKKKVHLEIHISSDRIEIRIGDEGDGFTLKDIPDPLAEENILKQSGRGILLIRAFVDEFEVLQRQPHGTEVRLVKHLAA